MIPIVYDSEIAATAEVQARIAKAAKRYKVALMLASCGAFPLILLALNFAVNALAWKKVGVDERGLFVGSLVTGGVGLALFVFSAVLRWKSTHSQEPLMVAHSKETAQEYIKVSESQAGQWFYHAFVFVILAALSSVGPLFAEPTREQVVGTFYVSLGLTALLLVAFSYFINGSIRNDVVAFRNGSHGPQASKTGGATPTPQQAG